MEIDGFVTALDAKIHETTGAVDDPIGVIRVNESSVLWSGRCGFVQAEHISASLMSFALHAGDEAVPKTRFADEMLEDNVAPLAERIVAFLNGATNGVS